MTTLGSNLDKVKIIKDKNIITIIESVSNQQYSGLGRAGSATLTVNETIATHYISNISITIKNNNVVIKTTTGIMHSFDFNIIEADGFTFETQLEFVKNLMK